MVCVLLYSKKHIKCKVLQSIYNTREMNRFKPVTMSTQKFVKAAGCEPVVTGGFRNWFSTRMPFCTAVGDTVCVC